jgi:hypothetical protein
VSAAAWALISPAGELTWRPLADTPKVEAVVSGEYVPGALDSAFVAGPLRVMASDIALVAPDHYPPNPVAERVITALSGGRILQPRRGHVALVQYEQDAATGEWLWPGEMSPQWAELIADAVRGAGGKVPQ